MNFAELPTAHGVVAGPSCPPFSRQGQQKGWHDSRSGSFLATLQCIREQAARPNSALIFFCVENVLGLGDVPKGETQSPRDEVVDYLVSELGSSWSVWSWKVNSLDCGLPQCRQRLMICGRLGRAFLTPIPRMEPACFKFQSIPLDKIFEPTGPELSIEAKLTPRMQANLDYYRTKHAECAPGTIIVCDLSRAPNKARKPVSRDDGVVPTLTTMNLMFIFQIGSNKFCRYISAKERLMLQGFDPDPILSSMSEARASFAAGNAMSVGAIGLTIACCLSDRI